MLTQLSIEGHVAELSNPTTYTSGGEARPKQELVVATDDGDEALICAYSGSVIDSLQDIEPGDYVTVTCELRSRRYKSRASGNPAWWLTLVARRVVRHADGTRPLAQDRTQPAPSEPSEPSRVPVRNQIVDNLPF